MIAAKLYSGGISKVKINVNKEELLQPVKSLFIEMSDRFTASRELSLSWIVRVLNLKSGLILRHIRDSTSSIKNLLEEAAK